jgi:ElaB/YqjD/DUF883 family membrane-anchored ribosome-binding protein
VDEGTRQGSPAVGTPGQRGPEQIRADIEHTRREVGDTAAALAQKADVKAQGRAKLEEIKARLRGKAQDTAHRVGERTPAPVKHAASTASTTAKQHPVPIGIGAAALVGAVLLGWRLGRRST